MKFAVKITIFGLLMTFLQVGLSQKIDAHILQELEQQEWVPAILVMKEQADVSAAAKIKGKEAKAYFVFYALSNFAQKNQHDIKKFLDQEGLKYQTYTLVNAISLHINKDILYEISKRSDVGSIVFDQPQPMQEFYLDRQDSKEIDLRSAQPTWGVTNIGADKLWERGILGDGVVIGGQDTGYSWALQQIRSKYRGYQNEESVDHNYSWHDAIHTASPLNSDTINPCGYNLTIPCDDNNHGTHTMGTMVGSDSLHLMGVAPQAKWVGCRNMERGWGSPSSYLECFNWFLAPTDLNNENPDPFMAPHVINNSWACPPEEGCFPETLPIMELAVNNLKMAGTVVVVSAGNEGPACGSIANPAAIFEPSFSIGAYNINNVIAGFSSRGSIAVDSSYRIKPNVAAPGVGVLSIIRNGSYANFSGTSMAGPHVAGLVALLISAKPELAGEVDLIEDIIEQSATPQEAEKSCFGIDSIALPNTTFGFGRVNAEKALILASTTKIESEDMEEVVIFPNPSQGHIFIKGTLPQLLEVFDTSGKKVFSIKPSEGIIMLPNLTNGLYQVVLHRENETKTKPLIVLK